MYNIQTLIEIIVEAEGMKDGIALLNDLSEEMTKDPSGFIHQFKNSTLEMCEEKRFCKDCLEFGEPEKDYSKFPFGDTYAYEPNCKMVCPDCKKEV
jgi:hypothetical protein